MNNINIPKVIGHRGAKASIPENTLSSFLEAKKQGASWIEFDVMLSKDNVPVIFHDETLKRMTGENGRIDEKTLSELKELKVNKTETIPTLEETLELSKELNLGINIEIKPSKIELTKITTKQILEVLKNSNISSDKVLFSSFQWDTLEYIYQNASEYSIGVLVNKNSKDWKKTAIRLNAFSVNFGDSDLTVEMVDDAILSGFKVLVYTVNSIERAEELWEMGVSSVFSDCPAFLNCK